MAQTRLRREQQQARYHQAMKKTFALQAEGLHPDRRLEAIKNEIRKYMRRERGKPLPKGADFWDFDCRFAVPPQEPQAIAQADLMGLVDGAAQGGAAQFYLEVLARPAQRVLRPVDPDAAPPTAAPYAGE